jgi:hypothetical protein
MANGRAKGWENTTTLRDNVGFGPVENDAAAGWRKLFHLQVCTVLNTNPKAIRKRTVGFA